MRVALDEAGQYGIGTREDYDRHRVRRSLDGVNKRRRQGDDDVHLLVDQLGRERREDGEVPMQDLAHIGDVPSLDIAEVAHPLDEGVEDEGHVRGRECRQPASALTARAPRAAP
jgi:hypothetical protein